LGLTRGKEGSKAKHTSIKAHYHDINHARDFTIKALAPKPEIFESKASYGEKVKAAVIKQVEPTVKAASSILMDYGKARLDKSVAEGSYDTLKKRVEPYLAAIEGLNQEEVSRVNHAMLLERRRIAVEKSKITNARYVSKDSYTAFKSKSVDK
jgi:hypothetical protein